VVPGIILLLVTFGFLTAFIQKLFRDPNGLLGMMLLGLALGLLWFIWMHLPGLVRKSFKRMLIGRKENNKGSKY
jgi:threonine/homoserine/homoserine lactone efflux protein